ncbi:MAG: methylenetetrahydromethanopterin dehydrogenase [Planctomycetota bacterium]|nr:methylenetetrahydromethanopterin dehydrogenase [Planctomycetota bacterium]MDA1177471.1 methylenetetrahydromethanopterin dehydrogenase [Planctomycetota bacterium]
MTLPKILLQFDPDPHPSSFDGVVAIDAGVDHLFQYSRVTPHDVRELVYGAIFTRSPKQLHSTAIFIGGRDVKAAELLLDEVQKTFFGPMRVSVMLDPNGANTTAAAAILVVLRHIAPPGTVAVLGGTGSVGRRVARLAASLGFAVRVVSRSLERATDVCRDVAQQTADGKTLVSPFSSETKADLQEALKGVDAVVAAGAPGVELLSQPQRDLAHSARVFVDLNAVPPLGIDGIEVNAFDVQQAEARVYGAIGVGGIKMMLHRTAIVELFSSNNVILDAERILALGRTIAN